MGAPLGVGVIGTGFMGRTWANVAARLPETQIGRAHV